MEGKFLHSLIYVFFGIIVLFGLLMAVNLIGSLAGRRYDAPEKTEAGGKPPSAAEMAQQALAAAKQSGGARASMVPSYRTDLSSAAVNSSGAIMLVKETSFNGVAEKPKTMEQVLEELGGGSKHKPAPVALKDKDLDKPVHVGGMEVPEPSLAASTMPELGRGLSGEGVTMLSAPVDFKVFRSSETWWAFANTHKCVSKMDATEDGDQKLVLISAPDFSAHWVVVLVSVSDLPNGILKIVDFKKAGHALAVSYRVDPLAMSAAATRDQHDFYSAAVIPAGLPVKLTQVP
jgi:hypothetical protein